MTFRPAVEMGLGMTIAGAVSVTLITVGLVRGRQTRARAV
jgi:hypothetical protein